MRPRDKKTVLIEQRRPPRIVERYASILVVIWKDVDEACRCVDNPATVPSNRTEVSGVSNHMLTFVFGH